MEGQPIRCAVIGYGHIGRRHAGLIQEHPKCELVAVCDVLLRESLKDYPQGVPYFPSMEALLTSGLALDVVHICTPNGLHAVQSLAALEARCHVVIEKPMALRKADCEKIIHRALNVGRQVFCVMQNRYSQPIAWLKQVVEAGLLGKLHLITARCYWNRDERYYFQNGAPHSWHGQPGLDGGVLFTQFAHFVDILYWIFGDFYPKGSNLLANLGHPYLPDAFHDTGVVPVLFENGALGSLTFSTAVWDRNFASTLTVLGEYGAIEIGGQYMDRLEYVHGKNINRPDLQMEQIPANDYGGYQGSASNHGYVIQNVVDVLSGRREVDTNALEGMKVVEIIERMYDAAT